MPRAVIAVIEPDIELSKALEEHLFAGSYKIKTFNSFKSYKIFSEESNSHFELIIASADMKDADTFSMLEESNKKESGLILIGKSAASKDDFERIMNLMRNGLDDYLSKPVGGVTLLASVNRILKLKSLEHRVKRLSSQVENLAGGNIIGSSKTIIRIMSDISKIAPTELPVLIIGETGTGKELVARKIHKVSGCKGDFVPINSATLSENLFEAELFGYEPGAFTGAKGRKAGLVEIADNGTLFLDEIADLPGAVQARLLRFLDDGKFRRLGGTREIETKVRIIAATNKIIAPSKNDNGQNQYFRTDLYYRLSGTTINIPPLRERKEDIPELVNHFIKTLSTSNNISSPSFSKEALELMMKQEWSGNVRELKNFVIKIVYSFQDKNTIDAEDIAESLTGVRRSDVSDVIDTTDYHILKKKLLDDFDKKYLNEIMIRNKHNISSAAKELGIDRKTLGNRLKELNLK